MNKNKMVWILVGFLVVVASVWLLKTEDIKNDVAGKKNIEINSSSDKEAQILKKLDAKKTVLTKKYVEESFHKNVHYLGSDNERCDSCGQLSIDKIKIIGENKAIVYFEDGHNCYTIDFEKDGKWSNRKIDEDCGGLEEVEKIVK